MSEIDNYEIVRQKLSLGPLYAPKHKKIHELLRILWNEEEINILAHFKDADHYTSLKYITSESGIPRKDIKVILERLRSKGTIARRASKYSLIPIFPGIFEKYFINRVDSEDNQKKVAEIYRWLFKNFVPSFFADSKVKFFRPRLPVDAKEKLIEIDENIDVESQILPYELITQLIDEYDFFSYIPCQCRLIGEMTGEPCSVAPSEMGCFLAGEGARSAIEGGMPNLNKDQALEYLRKTEKAGLIHNCVADSSVESTIFICNCCSCHCGALIAAKEHKHYGLLASNYVPRINNDVCTKCEICLKKCPMGIIYHRFPNEMDSSDENMFINEEYCIGCGVCATNCPNNAIKLVKVRDNFFTEKIKFGTKTMTELI
jgi:Pyruvate/2-oxoacid:ferredoxin oxidoreductase delta subunit